MYRHFPWCVLILVLLLTGLSCRQDDKAEPGGASEQLAFPNIVLILADDLGYGDVASYNPESRIPTPNIDQLSAQGVRFTDAHSPASICTPSRYAILTGRYAWRTRLKSGVTWGYSPPLIEPGELTLASMLKQKGYATACIGKWHLGLGWQSTDGGPVQAEPTGGSGNVDFTKPIQGGPNALGFDYFFGISVTLDFGPYCYIEQDRTVGIPSLMKTSDHLPLRYREQAPSVTTPGFRDDQVGPDFTDKAVSWMTRTVLQDPDRPFFLYLPLHSPHVPHVPPDFIAGISQAGRRGDMCAEVDWSVGRVLETLDQLGIAENTLVIFASDNGPLPGDRRELGPGEEYEAYGHPDNYETLNHRASGIYQGGKHSVYEGGHRVPFVARWPGRIAAGSTSDDLIVLNDIFATTAALLGTESGLDSGQDSFPIRSLLGKGVLVSKTRKAAVFQSALGLFAVREGPWKLIRGHGGGALYDREAGAAPGGPPGQLYQLDRDPGETTNVWKDHPEIVTRLNEMLDRVLSEPERRVY